MGVAALPVAVLALGLTFIAERNGERRVAVPPASTKPVAEVDTLLLAVSYFLI